MRPSRPIRGRFRLAAGLALAGLAGGLALGAAPAAPPQEAAERFVLLLQYVGSDYPAAVRDGKVIDAVELRELTGFSARLVDDWAALAGPDSPAEIATGLVELRDTVAAHGPVDRVVTLSRTLAQSAARDLGMDTRPPGPPDLVRGEAVFRSDCAPCHGANGAGDGPAAAGLEPRPLSFLDARMDLVSPHQAYLAARNGIPGTGMPAFRGARTDAELWDVAAYLLRLRPGAGETDPGLRTAAALEDVFARVTGSTFPGVVGVAAYAAASGAGAHEEGGPSWTVAPTSEDPYPGYRPVSAGSGTVVTDDGYVLTCQRLVVDPATGEPAEILDVEFDGNLHYRARLVGAEPSVGLAVLEVDVPFPTRPLSWGDADAVRVGQWAIAVADPPGVARTFSPGVGAEVPLRDCYQESRSATMIQTSVRADPDVCGGPVVDIRGALVGMALPPADRAGELDALPVDLTKTLYDAFRARESTRSPWLGFSVLELTWRVRQKLASSPRTGVYIDDVYRPSPASDAGIRPGDILVAMNGQRMLTVSDFQHWLYLFGIGAEVELELWRDGATETRTVTIEQRPAGAVPR